MSVSLSTDTLLEIVVFYYVIQSKVLAIYHSAAYLFHNFIFSAACLNVVSSIELHPIIGPLLLGVQICWSLKGIGQIICAVFI